MRGSRKAMPDVSISIQSLVNVTDVFTTNRVNLKLELLLNYVKRV